MTLLAESLQRLQIEIPHIVIANTEDLETFVRALAPYKSRIVPTADVLPREYERRRTNRLRRRNPRYWIEGRPIAGWGIQQLIKLCAPESLGLDVQVCVDSDVAFLRNVAPSHFVDLTTGLPFLYESIDDNAELMSWAVGAAKALGLNLKESTVRQYVHNPVVMDGPTVGRLKRHFSSASAEDFYETVLTGDTTEYALYGVYARNVSAACVTPSRPLYTETLWKPSAAPNGIAAWIRQTASGNPLPYAIGIQSTIPSDADEISNLVRRIWLDSGV